MRTPNRSTFGSTNGQPRGLASTDDGTVFVVTVNGVEVYAGGNVAKKVGDLPLKTSPLSIAVHGTKVAVGAEVSRLSLQNIYPSRILIIFP
jgi:hypothetical protein